MRKLIIGVVSLTVVLSAAAAVAQTDPEANKVGYWCEPDDAGVKYEPVDTPFVVPEPQEGTSWVLLVLKGGTTNETVADPVVGQGYSHSMSENSHTILCWEDEEVTTTTTSSTSSTTTTAPTTTTTSSSTTTTTEATTTTTDPWTTTSSSTTTTTSSVPATTTPTPSSSVVTPSSTVPPVTTTLPSLPVTGFDSGIVAAVGLLLVVLGGLTVWRLKTD